MLTWLFHLSCKLSIQLSLLIKLILLISIYSFLNLFWTQAGISGFKYWTLHHLSFPSPPIFCPDHSIMTLGKYCSSLLPLTILFVTPWTVACQMPLESPGQNTGVGSHSLLQGIFPTQGLNPGLPHCRWILYHLSHQGSKNTGVGSLSLLQGIIWTRQQNQGLLHCRRIPYQLS